MATLSDRVIEALLRPYLQAPLPSTPEGTSTATLVSLSTLVPALSLYLDLLLRWNERTNLTAIRDPEQIVERHFGESLFAARVLAIAGCGWLYRPGHRIGGRLSGTAVTASPASPEGDPGGVSREKECVSPGGHPADGRQR